MKICCDYHDTKEMEKFLGRQFDKEDENGNSGRAYGSHGLPEPDPSNFVAWDDLDEFTVLSWMTSDMVAKADEGENPAMAIEASVDAQIAEQAAPTTGSGVPW